MTVHIFNHSRKVIQPYVLIDFCFNYGFLKQIIMTQIISTEAPSSLCWGFLFLVEHFYSRAEKMLYSTSGNMRMK